MDTFYIITRLMMAICIITIVYVSLASDETVKDQNNGSSNHLIFTKGVKPIVRAVKKLYRIALRILITHLK